MVTVVTRGGHLGDLVFVFSRVVTVVTRGGHLGDLVFVF